MSTTLGAQGRSIEQHVVAWRAQRLASAQCVRSKPPPARDVDKSAERGEAHVCASSAQPEAASCNLSCCEP